MAVAKAVILLFLAAQFVITSQVGGCFAQPDWILLPDRSCDPDVGGVGDNSVEILAKPRFHAVFRLDDFALIFANVQAEENELRNKRLSKIGFVADIAYHFQHVSASVLVRTLDGINIAHIPMGYAELFVSPDRIPTKWFSAFEFLKPSKIPFVGDRPTCAPQFKPSGRCHAVVNDPQDNIRISHRFAVPSQFSIANMQVRSDLRFTNAASFADSHSCSLQRPKKQEGGYNAEAHHQPLSQCVLERDEPFAPLPPLWFLGGVCAILVTLYLILMAFLGGVFRLIEWLSELWNRPNQKQYRDTKSDD